MPARAAAADGRVPRGLRFAGRFFPEREVTRVFFLVTIGVDSFTRAGDVAREVDLRQLSVLRKRSDAIVDRLVRTIRMTGLEQFLDQADHFGNVTRGAWYYIGAFATERIEIFPERLDVDRGVVVDTQAAFL